MATYEHDGVLIDLPKLTLSLDEAFDRALDKSRPKRERAKDAYKLMKDVLGADHVAERCGGKTLETIDVSQLWLMLGEVHDAYTEGVNEADMARVMARLEEAAPMLDNMAKITPLIARHGFKAVQ